MDKKNKKRILILLMLGNLFFLVHYTFAKINSNTKESIVQKNKNPIKKAKYKCDDLYKFVYYKYRRWNRYRFKKFKNQIVFCSGVIKEIRSPKQVLFTEIESYRKYIKRNLYVIKVESKIKRKRVNLFILTQNKNSIVDLMKGDKIDFTGQLLFIPFYKKKRYNLIFYNQQIAYRIE